jgi:uncharacterized protein YecT (DUF1311 family)
VQQPSQSRRPAGRARRRCAVFLAIGLLAVAAAVVLPGAVGAAAKPTAPVIEEAFAVLPCPDPKSPGTTLEMQGCAQREILASDKKIDAVAKAIFGRLRGDAARRRFVKAQRAWLAFRTADCASVADKYQGGSLASVTRLQCVVERNVQHLKEIRAFDRLLRREG